MLTVSLLWALFAGSHIVLATDRLRRPLAGWMGERAFLLFYGVTPNGLFTLLTYAYAVERFDGPAGPALAASNLIHPLLVGAILIGVALMVASFAPKAYWQSPFMLGTTAVRGPFGLERITRHPFFTGLILFAGAHALAASHLVGTIYFGGFIVLTIAGTFHQGVKQRRKLGTAYTNFLDKTSSIPFVAIAQRRQNFVFSEIPWSWLALGMVIGIALTCH